MYENFSKKLPQLLHTKHSNENLFSIAIQNNYTSIIDAILDFVQDCPDIREELLFQRDFSGHRTLYALFENKEHIGGDKVRDIIFCKYFQLWKILCL